MPKRPEPKKFVCGSDETFDETLPASFPDNSWLFKKKLDLNLPRPWMVTGRNCVPNLDELDEVPIADMTLVPHADAETDPLLLIPRVPVHCAFPDCPRTVAISSILSHYLVEHSPDSRRLGLDNHEIFAGDRKMIIFDASQMQSEKNICLGVLLYAGTMRDRSCLPGLRKIALPNNFLLDRHQHLSNHLAVLVMACRTSWYTLMENGATLSANTDKLERLKKELLFIWMVSSKTLTPIFCTITAFDMTMEFSASASTRVRNISRSQNPASFHMDECDYLRLTYGEINTLTHNRKKKMLIEVMLQEYGQFDFKKLDAEIEASRYRTASEMELPPSSENDSIFEIEMPVIPPKKEVKAPKRPVINIHFVEVGRTRNPFAKAMDFVETEEEDDEEAVDRLLQPKVQPPPPPPQAVEESRPRSKTASEITLECKPNIILAPSPVWEAMRTIAESEVHEDPMEKRKIAEVSAYINEIENDSEIEEFASMVYGKFIKPPAPEMPDVAKVNVSESTSDVEYDLYSLTGIRHRMEEEERQRKLRK